MTINVWIYLLNFKFKHCYICVYIYLYVDIYIYSLIKSYSFLEYTHILCFQKDLVYLFTAKWKIEYIHLFICKTVLAIKDKTKISFIQIIVSGIQTGFF